MTPDLERIADAVLYEGYLLYPYRRSDTKNQQWWPFGALHPEPFCRAHQAGDSPFLELQCLVLGGPELAVEARLRFLQLGVGETVARQIDLALADPLASGGERHHFHVPPITGLVESGWTPLQPGVFKLTLRVTNVTAFTGDPAARDEALRHTMASTHLLLAVRGGELVSLVDPPESLRELAAGCRNVGTWPVLVGAPGTRQALLAAPIILYDYPQIAPESPGDLFDGLEIDEILTLRILTLTDEEKRALAAGDPRARALLERTEALDEDRRRQLHGRLARRAVLGPGAAVRLRPRRRADIFDLALAGRTATVESLEEDLEGVRYVVVTVDDDPGKDLGAFGHRFFFHPDEVEPL